VDQPSFVALGKEKYQDASLVFYSDIHECIEREHINVVLLSGVMQYIEKPHIVLRDILSLGINTVIVDRTPFLENAARDRLTVQRVPPSIYSASYPHWFFERSGFLKHFSDHGYHIVAEYDGFDKANIRNSMYCGFIFSRSESSSH
jgi:putative methyltransferase (TIGR04325 family)